MFEKWGTDAAEACLAAAPFSVADFREQHLRILILKLGVSDNVRARRRAFVDAFNNRIASEVRRG
ncbi:hypothetical protein ACQUFY_16815 [Robbsia andropogonis]|uniref:hypothetical protein n=1 Tax=Robbsia andropogonis TaxID=28092 RepID=UPI003D21EF5E